jgi:prephenate dehydrogenase
MINKLAIIGVGLIGSSLSLALKQAGAVGQVFGYGRNRGNLEKGVELGVLDGFELSIADCVRDADVIVVAVPLGAMQPVFAELKPVISNTAIIWFHALYPVIRLQVPSRVVSRLDLQACIKTVASF